MSDQSPHAGGAMPADLPPTHVIFVAICKDEAVGAVRTLDSHLGFISRFFILDTGSTDGTPDIIRAWGERNGIPGTVVEGTWPAGGFAEARNQAKAMAVQGAPPGAWVLEADFDWIWKCADRDGLFRQLASVPEHVAGFKIPVQQPGVTLGHCRLRSVRHESRWRYSGATHEGLRYDGVSPTVGDLSGACWVHEDTTTPEARLIRYARDRAALQPGADEGEPRATFYLAQTHECLGDKNAAFEWYKARTEIETGDGEERAVAAYRAGMIAREFGFHDSARECFLASAAIVLRPEALWGAASVGVRGAARLAWDLVNRTQPHEYLLSVEHGAWALSLRDPRPGRALERGRQLAYLLEDMALDHA